MGGTALGRRAQSLTSPQFDKLASFCKSQLTTLFPDIRIEYCPRDKLIHGDVDLLCSWDGVGVGQHIGGYDRSDEDKGTHPVLRALAFEMMNLLGGVKWVRKSDQVNIAIPCNVIGVKGTDEQSFFQVDVNLLPPPSLDLCLLLMSYRSNIVILPRAIAKISPSLQLHQPRLFLKHTIQVGQPAIEITLTSSAKGFCDWGGLDWKTFGVFNTEAELYRWLTNVKKDSLIGKVWSQVSRGDVMPKKYGTPHATRKTEGWDMLAKWIREDEQSPFKTIQEVATSVQVDSSPGESRPLDPIARAALVRWNKLEEFEEVVLKRSKGMRR